MCIVYIATVTSVTVSRTYDYQVGTMNGLLPEHFSKSTLPH